MTCIKIQQRVVETNKGECYSLMKTLASPMGTFHNTMATEYFIFTSNCSIKL